MKTVREFMITAVADSRSIVFFQLFSDFRRSKMSLRYPLWDENEGKFTPGPGLRKLAFLVQQSPEYWGWRDGLRDYVQHFPDRYKVQTIIFQNKHTLVLGAVDTSDNNTKVSIKKGSASNIENEGMILQHLNNKNVPCTPQLQLCQENYVIARPLGIASLNNV